MTSKGLVLYYSATGNTRHVAEMFPTNKYDVYNIKNFVLKDIYKYQTIVLGMSTWERGMPPKIFQKYAPYLVGLENRKIYLFGSGRIEYEYYCGALDLFKEILSQNNKVLDIFKFEGFPSDNMIKEAKNFINKISNRLGE